MKNQIEQLDQFLKEKLGNTDELKKLEIDTKYEAMIQILNYNYWGIMSNGLALEKLREICEIPTLCPY